MASSKLHGIITSKIVAIAILAVISGADDMVAVATYGKAKAAWLKTFLTLPNGIPSHDTFSRVLGLIAPSHYRSAS